MIIASSDYIYGTNYQFCHSYIGNDLSNMSHEKLIQSLGRVGRKNIQYNYTIRFRNNTILRKLFLPDEIHPEINNMIKDIIITDCYYENSSVTMMLQMLLLKTFGASWA